MKYVFNLTCMQFLAVLKKSTFPSKLMSDIFIVIKTSSKKENPTLFSDLQALCENGKI